MHWLVQQPLTRGNAAGRKLRRGEKQAEIRPTQHSQHGIFYPQLRVQRHGQPKPRVYMCGQPGRLLFSPHSEFPDGSTWAWNGATPVRCVWLDWVFCDLAAPFFHWSDER
jgi:hypothetical protein